MVQNIANSNCKNVKIFDNSARIKRFQFFYVELKLKFDQSLKIVPILFCIFWIQKWLQGAAEVEEASKFSMHFF